MHDHKKISVTAFWHATDLHKSFFQTFQLHWCCETTLVMVTGRIFRFYFFFKTTIVGNLFIHLQYNVNILQKMLCHCRCSKDNKPIFEQSKYGRIKWVWMQPFSWTCRRNHGWNNVFSSEWCILAAISTRPLK